MICTINLLRLLRSSEKQPARYARRGRDEALLLWNTKFEVTSRFRGTGRWRNGVCGASFIFVYSRSDDAETANSSCRLSASSGLLPRILIK